MRALITFILMCVTYHITPAIAKDNQFDFRNFEPVAFGMLMTSVEGNNKHVRYLSERRDLSLAKFLVHTDRTEIYIYCYGKMTNLPKTDHFVALQGKSLEYVVELKDQRLSSCWLSKKELF